MPQFTRRGFMKSSGATAGVVLATGAAAPPHDKNKEKIRVGMIGTGGRGTDLLREGLWANDDLEIVAVADVYKPHQKGGSLQGWLANAQISLTRGRPTPEQREKLRSVIRPAGYYDFREMLATETLDAVVIATPPHTHHAIISTCLDAGKHVFCEPPLAMTVADGRKIVQKAHATGRVAQMGFQRRYHPNCNLAMKQIYEKHALGRLTRFSLRRHRNTSVRRVLENDYVFNEQEKQHIASDLEHHLNWRLYQDIGGSPFFDYLARHVDIVHWACGTPPVRVFAAGGVDYWRDGRTAPDNLLATLEYAQTPNQPGFYQQKPRNRFHRESELNSNHALRGDCSYQLANGERELTDGLFGDEGRIVFGSDGSCRLARAGWVSSPYYELTREQKIRAICDVYQLSARRDEDQAEIKHYLTAGSTVFPVPEALRNYPTSLLPLHAVGSEESAEVHQFRAFSHHIRHGGPPRANVMVGLAAVIAGASAQKSYETGNPVDIDPAWMEFDFDTPSITDYDSDITAIEAED